MYRVYSLEDEYHHQGTCSKGCAVVRVLASHQCGPGSNPGVNAICRLSLFVVGSLLCSERFFSACSVFPSTQKPTLPNSNSIWNARTRLNEFSRTLKYFLAKRITITLFYQIYLGVRGDGLARLPPSTAINPRAHPSVLLIQRWPPLTESARSRRSYGKIKDWEQSKLVKSIAGRFVQCLDNVR